MGGDSQNLSPKTRVVFPGDLIKEFPPGTRIDRYEIIGTLGSGGCGVVYSAKHVHLDQTVALKLLHRELIGSEERVQRFFREARTAAAVGNSHIVQVMDCGISTEGVPFLAMEFLKGVVLEDLLDGEQPLPLERAVDIALQTLDGLSAASAAGVVHRDVKPENIFLTPPRGRSGDFVKILDFGASKTVADTSQQGSITGRGSFIGTPRYMAPEQFWGADTVDQRADLFAMSVVLFQMLTGKPPFEGRNPVDVAHFAATKPPRSIEDIAPHVPKEICAVVYRGLEKDPNKRWPDAATFARALRHAYKKTASKKTAGDDSRDTDPRPGKFSIDVVTEPDIRPSAHLLALEPTIPSVRAKNEADDINLEDSLAEQLDDTTTEQTPVPTSVSDSGDAIAIVSQSTVRNQLPANHLSIDEDPTIHTPLPESIPSELMDLDATKPFTNPDKGATSGASGTGATSGASGTGATSGASDAGATSGASDAGATSGTAPSAGSVASSGTEIPYAPRASSSEVSVVTNQGTRTKVGRIMLLILLAIISLVGGVLLGLWLHQLDLN